MVYNKKHERMELKKRKMIQGRKIESILNQLVFEEIENVA